MSDTTDRDYEEYLAQVTDDAWLEQVFRMVRFYDQPLEDSDDEDSWRHGFTWAITHAGIHDVAGLRRVHAEVVDAFQSLVDELRHGLHPE